MNPPEISPCATGSFAGTGSGACTAETSFPGEQLSLDHVQPRMRGGDNSEGNLVTACHACNTRKGSQAAWAFLAELPDERANFLHYATAVWPRHLRAIQAAARAAKPRGWTHRKPRTGIGSGGTSVQIQAGSRPAADAHRSGENIGGAPVIHIGRAPFHAAGLRLSAAASVRACLQMNGIARSRARTACRPAVTHPRHPGSRTSS